MKKNVTLALVAITFVLSMVATNAAYAQRIKYHCTLTGTTNVCTIAPRGV